jgi:hypothetical protein
MTNKDGSLLHPQTPGYMRSYGFLKNPTMTATFIVAIFLINNIDSSLKSRFTIYFDYIALSLAIIALGSGFGYFLLAIVFLLKFNKIKNNKTYIIFLSLVSIFVLIFNSFDEDTFYRFSIKNVFLLIDYKYNTLVISNNYSIANILFGNFNIRNFSTDMGLYSLYYGCGIAGLIIYLICYLNNKKSIYFIPISVLYFGMLHYPAIFSIPGQILFAHLITKSKYA